MYELRLIFKTLDRTRTIGREIDLFESDGEDHSTATKTGNKRRLTETIMANEGFIKYLKKEFKK